MKQKLYASTIPGFHSAKAAKKRKFFSRRQWTCQDAVQDDDTLMLPDRHSEDRDGRRNRHFGARGYSVSPAGSIHEETIHEHTRKKITVRRPLRGLLMRTDCMNDRNRYDAPEALQSGPHGTWEL